LKADYLLDERSHINIDKRYNERRIEVNRKMDFLEMCDDFGVQCKSGQEHLQRLKTLHDSLYLLFASDDLITNEAATWDKNCHAFFNLAKMMKHNADSQSKSEGVEKSIKETPRLVFVDCSVSPLSEAEEAIRNGIVIIHS